MQTQPGLFEQLRKEIDETSVSDYEVEQVEAALEAPPPDAVILGRIDDYARRVHYLMTVKIAYFTQCISHIEDARHRSCGNGDTQGMKGEACELRAQVNMLYEEFHEHVRKLLDPEGDATMHMDIYVARGCVAYAIPADDEQVIVFEPEGFDLEEDEVEYESDPTVH